MVQKITNDIVVKVETFYQEKASRPRYNEHMFSYRISIENQSSIPIKLLRRHWYIIESYGDMREVVGEGVVGQQPIIEPGDAYQYMSSCLLNSDLGKMYGYYEMENLFSKKLMKINIPDFQLIASSKNN